MRAIRRFNVRTVLPPAIADLGALAMNLRWSWHAETAELFASIAPAGRGEEPLDPVSILSDLSTERLDTLSRDEDFVARVAAASADLQRYLTAPRWYQEWSGTTTEKVPECIAYFSAEFGIAEALPQYSGGLGILAGDHLKASSDLGVPLIGIGLFYQTGYFAQSLGRDGWQQETYPILDPDGLPLSLLREADGTASVIELDLPGRRTLKAHVWRAQVGRIPLLLLDSDVHDNDESLRMVTNRLYGGGGEQRLMQEMLLGMGGVKALRLWSRLTGAPPPDVYHANEGHAGFNSVERISELVVSDGLTFDEALSAVRASTVFTTHTPVPAGIDRFGLDLIRHYFSGDAEVRGVPPEQLLALGREDYPGGDQGVFNLAVMGLRVAQRANGVSQLHGQVSREMFAALWPGFDVSEVPITSITNGVHAPTWTDERILRLADSIEYRDKVREKIEVFGARATDRQIWDVKRDLRAQLVDDARRRVRQSWLDRGASAAELGWVDSILDPDVLTIGFARRVPTYKRLTLMLRDPERLTKLLLHESRPIQLVIAGKSHPADDNGKRLIQKVVQFADDPRVRHRIVFLPNYGIGMARYLYPGCDVWLNNPLRPLEACGTSGMKAALNGALNLSVLDGWWDEWYDGHNGWDIPTADGVTDPERRDDLEAAALYDILEKRVAPLFYTTDDDGVDGDGIPQRWVDMLRHTWRVLAPKVQATRMVREYTEELYAPAARSGGLVAAEGYSLARDLAAYRRRVVAQWPLVRVDHVESSELSDNPQVGDTLHVRAFVSVGDLTPEDITVQVVYGRAGDGDLLSDTESVDLRHTEAFEGGRHTFESDLEISRTGSFGYSVRVLPRHPALTGAAELGLTANA